LVSLVSALTRTARGPAGDVVVPGWTHLQPAQRVYVGQILGTHALRFLRDLDRFRSIRVRIRECPLGSGALAGSSLPLDRARTAHLLGFDRPTLSSLDAVSDRDAATETLAALALFAVHASGLAEELVLGAMPEVGRVRLADAFVTTSSLMPHKRNPDLAELIRGESGPAIGRLTSALALLKGLPLAYNRDLQVGKPILFEGIARAELVLAVLPAMVETAEFRRGTPIGAATEATTGSVEIVDDLVRSGVPFRRAHARVAAFLRDVDASGGVGGGRYRERWALAFPELGVGPPEEAGAEPERRTTPGGSARSSVRTMLADAERRVLSAQRAIEAERRRLDDLRVELDRPIRPRRRRRR
jgi:argininosuccinate lyase